MLSSFWNDFLQSLNKNQEETPILYSVLKQTKPLELTDHSITIGCDNTGLKFFLERKTSEIEKKLSLFAKRKIKIVFVVVDGEKNKKKESPLFSFQPSQEDILLKSGLSNKYSFENFAVSSTNQVAYAAAQAVSENLGTAYNPLFLYGGVGVGKTHLAQSVARRVLEKNPEERVFFCPSDRFTNELIESIRQKTTQNFRKKYRNLRLLIIDDIQFIAGKQHIQEEFFHTFNSIVSVGGQIILTSDRHPSEIKNLEDRLCSRFSGGLIIDIQPPDFELRSAIVLIKARERKIQIDIEAAKIIAERITDSRALEGTLLSIYAATLGIKEKIDLEAVEKFFSKKTKTTSKKITPSDIIRAVSSYFNIPQSHLKGKSRSNSVSLPRQMAMYLLRKELDIKYEEVALLLKRKDHTTVIHAFNKISRLIAKDPSIRQDIENITKSLISST